MLVATDVRSNFTRAFYLSNLLCLYSLPQATERKLTAAELDELRRKNALVIQKERKKEEQTRKYGAPIGQAFL